jgi:hypothetical protein
VRSLAPSPATFVDPETGAPAFGSYRGPLPRVVVPGLGLRDRFARRKKWLYVAIAAEDVWISLAVVRTGYAATAFAFAYDFASKTMLVDRTVLGPTPLSRVADGPHDEGAVARFAMGKTSFVLARGGSRLDVRVKIGALDVEAALDESSAPPSITAVARLGDGLINATEKRALTKVSGTARIDGRTVDLSRAVGGWDYTHGLLPRHTKWNWAFGLGKANDGRPIGFNVVQGFVGEAECAAFIDGDVHPIAEPKFGFDADRPELPWTLRGDGIDLTFETGAVHAQHTNLGIIRSRFVQPVGTFSGLIRIAGKDVLVRNLPGVVEDQDVLW